MLAALARALRLTDDERDHLFRLAGEPAPEPQARSRHLRPGVLHLLDQLADSAVMVVNDLGDVLAWTPLAQALFTDFSALPGERRNLYCNASHPRPPIDGRHLKVGQPDRLRAKQAGPLPPRSVILRARARPETSASCVYAGHSGSSGKEGGSMAAEEGRTSHRGFLKDATAVTPARSPRRHRCFLLVELLTLVTFVLVGAVACTHSTAGRSGGPAASPAAGDDATSTAVPTTTATGTATKPSPEQLGAQFDQLLGRHALLAVRLMRSVVLAAPDFRQAAVASLQENTGALSQLVGTAYGSTQGERFQQVWQRRTDDLFSYANGVASDDTSATRTARAALMADADAYGSWFAGASEGQARASDASDGARTNVEELMQQLDAYAAHDYNRAYQIERAAYEHMFTAGGTMAKASLAPKAAAGLDSPPNKLRSAFAMLLGEHMELIIDAQRATFAGSPEFKAAAAQINANSTALAQGLGAIVGPAKGAEFQSAWADHVTGLLAYTTAVAGKDQAAKDAAEQKLHSFAVTLAAYFSGVVRNQAAFVPLTGAITAHDAHLIDQVNAYAARDYARAQQMELHGYQQMLGVADTLVDAIQRAVKPGLPVGGSQTGGGGTAQRP